MVHAYKEKDTRWWLVATVSCVYMSSVYCLPLSTDTVDDATIGVDDTILSKDPIMIMLDHFLPA